MLMWNPWHGCHKISAGCRHCYVYREDTAFGAAIPPSVVRKTASFGLPVRLNRKREYKYPSGSCFGLCFTSDFLIEKADEWRPEIWEIIKRRNDCSFFFFTKRIERLKDALPSDWDNGYENIAIGCTVENQDRANFRLPIFLNLPLKHRLIIISPMLEPIDISPYLNSELIEEVSVGGESGRYARSLDYDWVLDIHRQCLEHNVPFCFHQTGSHFIKQGHLYHIPRALQHSQALKAGINTITR